MGVLAIHGQNYKSTQIVALERHNMRKNAQYSNKNIDANKTKDNVVLIEIKQGLYKTIKNRIENEVLPYQKKALRKDANWMVEFCVTMPEDVKKLKDIKLYCNVVLDYFANKVGRENIISAVIHMDESTPHMHLDFTPITVDHRLSSKQIMTREFLMKLHNELPAKLQEAGFDVTRGEAVPDEQKGEKKRDIKQYKKDMEKEKKELSKQIRALITIKERLLQGNRVLAEQIIERLRGKGQEKSR